MIYEVAEATCINDVTGNAERYLYLRVNTDGDYTWLNRDGSPTSIKRPLRLFQRDRVIHSGTFESCLEFIKAEGNGCY